MDRRAKHDEHSIKEQSDCMLMMHMLRLKKEKIRFIRNIEARHHGVPRPLMEKEAQKIDRYRRSIRDTLSALEKKGKTYELDAREKEALQFQKNIPFISHINFYLGGYLGGLEKYELRMDKEQAYMTYSLSDTTSVPPLIVIEPAYLPKKECLSFLCSLHMGEWQSDYSTNRKPFRSYHKWIWRVEVYYANPFEKREFGGLNAFPYNFSRFLHFFESYKKTIYTI